MPTDTLFGVQWIMTPNAPDVDPNEAEHLAAQHRAEEIPAGSTSARQNYTPATPSPHKPIKGRRAVRWKEKKYPEAGRMVSKEELRQELGQVLGAAVHGFSNHVLLIKSGAGSGKTYAAIEAAQNAAREGKRVLWVTERHDAFDNLKAFPHFIPQLWYNFQPMGPTKTHDPFCREHHSQSIWLSRGYSGMDLCRAICPLHIKECPYRLQQNQPEPIWVARHEHLSFGIAVKENFNCVIIDELPLKAFWKWRTIPAGKIQAKNAMGPIEKFLAAIEGVCQSKPLKPVAGRELWDVIGPMFADVEAQAELVANTLPAPPEIFSPADVLEADYWFCDQLVRLATDEFVAWENRVKWEKSDRKEKEVSSLWAERIRVNWLTDKNGVKHYGLEMLQRSPLWKSLPETVIQLDATATPALYEQIFTGKKVEVANLPTIKRTGAVYQITGKNYGITTTKDMEGEGLELVRLIEHITGFYQNKRIGIICHKHMRDFLEAYFNDLDRFQFMHYFNQRGSNGMIGVDVLIMAGTPQPSPDTVFSVALALNPENTKGFHRMENGEKTEPYTQEEKQFVLTKEAYAKNGGRLPFRECSGYWKTPELQAVFEQLSTAELVQGVERARGLTRDCVVWIISGNPTPLPLSGVWDECPVVNPDIVYPTPILIVTEKDGKEKITRKERLGPDLGMWNKTQETLSQRNEWTAVLLAKHLFGLENKKDDDLTDEEKERIRIRANTITQEKWLWWISRVLPNEWQFVEGRSGTKEVGAIKAK